MGESDYFNLSPENLYVGQVVTELDMEQLVSKLGKEYDKAVYRHPAY